MNVIIGLGRYLFGAVIAMFGVTHFMNADAMSELVPLSGGLILVYLAGAGFVLSAISIFIGKYDKLACVLLAVQLLVFVAMLHIPQAMSSDQIAATGGMINALKDIGLSGAALMAAAQARDSSVIG